MLISEIYYSDRKFTINPGLSATYTKNFDNDDDGNFYCYDDELCLKIIEPNLLKFLDSISNDIVNKYDIYMNGDVEKFTPKLKEFGLKLLSRVKEYE